ncbi:autotransporter outer membrane beta-barrel domain-containing protein [Insolitispirillum peregrinum]
MGAVTQALSTIQVRTDAVRVASSGTGISSGETLKGLGVWGQGFGSTARQGERNDVSGYDADTYGLAFGADFKVIDPVRVGLSFAYANTGVDSTGDRTGSGQDIDSYIASLYGTYSGNGWYADGALTYGIHKYDATRHVAIAGAASQTLKASYDGQQVGARVEAGVPLAVGQAVVTPLASLAYNTLKQDSYGETGGSAALQVGSSSTDSIRSGLGAKVSARVATIGNWEISPNARAVWHHEFNTSSQDQTSAYVAGGSSFTTPGSNIATEHFNIGVGLDVASVRNTTVSAKYDADLADKYVSHSASLQLRTEF